MNSGCRKLLALSSVMIALLLLGASARADVIWVGWNSTDWGDPGNWWDNVANVSQSPTNTGSGTVVINPGPNVCVVSNAGNYTMGFVYVSIGVGITVLPDGQLTVPGDFVTGVWGNSLPVEVTGGELNIGGYLNISPRNGDGTNYVGHVNISGGMVTAGNLTIGASTNAVIDLSGTGKFVTVIGQLANINYWINYGHNITAFGGTGAVNVDTNTNPGHIILTGVAAPPITTRYWNGSASQSWSNPNNFQSQGSNLPGVPETGNTIWLAAWAASEPLINNSGNATLNAVYADKNATIATGGSLSTTYFKLGQDTNAMLTVSGGSLSAANHLDVGGYSGGVATLNMSGGSVTVGGLYLNLSGDMNSVGGSFVNLSGGTLTDSGALSINESHATLMNLAGGTLVLPSSQLTAARIWMIDGSIAAYGVAGSTNNFNIDQTTIPGSLVVTAIYSGFVADTFTQWNPQVFTNLPTALDQSMPLVPSGLHVLTNANYCFGTAVGTNGEVYFTEWENQTVRKYNPVSGALTTVVSGRAEIFGVATDNAGNLFYSQDSEASMPHGTVIKRTPGGSETTIITNLVRPRQIATDTAGNLYVVLEAGQILKWTKSTGVTTTLVGQDQMSRTAEGIAVAPDGRIYFSTYGHGAGPGTALTAGAVWVRETSGAIRPIAAGFARGRGLALHPNGDLYLAAEANVWDNGNSGILVRIGTNGVVTRVMTGLDYPQFPSIGADGKVYVSIARDDKLVCYDPQNSFAPQTIATPGVTLIAEGATWQQTAGANYPIQLHLTNTNNLSDTMTIAGFLQATQANGKIGMWFNVPVTNLHISLVAIPDPNSGNTNTGDFLLPASSVTCAYGAAESFVIPLREHKRCRWPMTNLGTALESPGPGFGETPVSYLVYVSVESRPALKIQPWTGNQVRISWPVTATAAGYSLRRSTTVGTGYSSPSLSVATEGSDSVSYDTIVSGARFYRLIK